MKYRLVIYSIVYDEILEAVVYYESIYSQLGLRFEIAVQKVLDNLERVPFHYFNLDDNKHRRIVVEDFPYAFIYEIRDDEVIIKMLFHQLQDPAKMWMRIKD